MMDLATDTPTIADDPRSIRLLYVEDDVIAARLVKRCLEKIGGYQVDLAENGQRGVELATARPYDVMLVDHDMPEIGGLELVRLLRARGNGVPAIMITGAGDEETAISALKSGCRDYIVKDVDGSFLHLLPAVVDQVLQQEESERMLAERNRENQRLLSELQEANRELEKLNGLKNEVLGIVAHDLRSPLSSIITAVNVLLSDEENPHSRRFELLTICQESSAQVLNIVEELLNPKHLESGDLPLSLESRSLTTIAREVVKLHQANADRKRILLDCAGLESDALARLDPNRCRELVDNLLSNAIKYSPAGSSVSLQIFRDRDHVCLSVRDEGPGFTEEDQRHLYKRFRRLSARPTGNETSTGLGLSIVKRIADLHRAELRLFTRPGVGSEFVVSFLAAESDDEPPTIR